jgi:hypothetical protein
MPTALQKQKLTVLQKAKQKLTVLQKEKQKKATHPSLIVQKGFGWG